MPGGPEFLILAVFWVLPALALWTIIRRPSDRSVAAFAESYEVPLTAGNVEQLRRYIQWTRRWRVGGAIISFVAAAIVAAFRRESAGNPWLVVVIGYSLGSLLGELFRPAERISGSALASLHRRRISDYVVRRFLLVTVLTAVASLLPAAFLLASNPQRSWVEPSRFDGLRERPQDWFVLTLVSVIAITSIGCWVGCRMLAQAPMPADTPDRLAVRHAIRTAAILSVVGGATMIVGGVGAKLGNAATLLDGDATKSFQWILNIAWFGCLLATLWGGLLTLTSIPRFAPFSGRLPAIPPAAPPPAPGREPSGQC